MSALLEEIESNLACHDWLIALDRDGTLVPYADRPEAAVVTAELNSCLNELARRDGVCVAIVSARSVAQLSSDFDSRSLILAGNYGREISFPGRERLIQPLAQAAVPFLKRVRDELACQVGFASGAILEDHGYSLCLHWHTVPLPFRDRLHLAVSAIAGDFSMLKFEAQPTSYEVLPADNWDKSGALAVIDQQLPLMAARRVYFYAGDSAADVPAFCWSQQRNGITVRVGLEESLGAAYRLDRPDDLLNVLQYIAAAKKTDPGSDGVRLTSKQPYLEDAEVD